MKIVNILVIIVNIMSFTLIYGMEAPTPIEEAREQADFSWLMEDVKGMHYSIRAKLSLIEGFINGSIEQSEFFSQNQHSYYLTRTKNIMVHDFLNKLNTNIFKLDIAYQILARAFGEIQSKDIPYVSDIQKAKNQENEKNQICALRSMFSSPGMIATVLARFKQSMQDPAKILTGPCCAEDFKTDANNLYQAFQNKNLEQILAHRSKIKDHPVKSFDETMQEYETQLTVFGLSPGEIQKQKKYYNYACENSGTELPFSIITVLFTTLAEKEQ